MSKPTDPAALIERRRAARIERLRIAEDRWRRYVEASRGRYGARPERQLPPGLVSLLARGKAPGRALLLAASGIWHGWLREGLGSAAGPAASLFDYVRAGPDSAVQPKALFDQPWYLAGTHGLAGSRWAPLAHYLILGEAEGRSPHPLFDAAAYRARHAPKLAAGRFTALQHFLFRGAAEGSNPHPLFDARFYVGQSEEVARTGENPLIHYLRRGWREGLDPHPLFANAWYLAQNRDAAEAEIAPLLHYVTTGALAGRDPHPLFDTAWWARQRRGPARGADPLSDFLQAAGREPASPTPHFDAAYYLRQAGPEARANPLLHYVTTGAFEGVWPAPDFDEAAYFAAYPQAADAPASGLEHWLRHKTDRPEAGAAVGRTLSAETLFQDLRAAATPDPLAYDLAAYEALTETRAQMAAAAQAHRVAPRPAGVPLTSAEGVAVITVEPGGVAAANAALRTAAEPLILLVRPGLLALPGWSAALTAAADDEDAWAPRLLSPDGRLSAAGGRIGPDGALQPVGRGEDPAAQPWTSPRRVDAGAGALALRRSALTALGDLDEAYLTPEGALSDLALRLCTKGISIVYAPAAALLAASDPQACAGDLARDRQRLFERWAPAIEDLNRVGVIAFRRAATPDWLAVARALPNYRGHAQPKLPADLGFYDATHAETLRRQAELAARYGLAGFCHEVADPETAARLWAAGGRETPFCLAWTGADEPAPALAALAPGLTAAGAIRVQGRPLLVLQGHAGAKAWRTAGREAGLGELYLTQRGGPGHVDPRTLGFDARLEGPPAGGAPTGPPGPVVNPAFRGLMRDYRQLVREQMAERPSAWPRIACLVPSWDATPTSQDGGRILYEATPGAFQAWLEAAMDAARRQAGPGERLVFIDAWNDWANGAALEPDQRFGHGWLEAIANAADAELLER